LKSKKNIIINLGNCSFGIYLIHPFLINAVKYIIAILYHRFTQEVTIMSMLSFSILSFLLSWLLVYFLIKNKRVAKYLFGT
jgi:peptidoglycan/LPS O-acetylase OafA/YrhL